MIEGVQPQSTSPASREGFAGASRRVEDGRVAPLNPNPRWPQGYFQVLEEMGVQERRRGFYAHWVRQFFNRCQGDRRRRDLGRDDMEAFLAALVEQSGVADWQVAQARDALEIYYEQFRGIALDPAPGTAPRRQAGHPEPADGTICPPVAPTAASGRSQPAPPAADVVYPINRPQARRAPDKPAPPAAGPAAHLPRATTRSHQTPRAPVWERATPYEADPRSRTIPMPRVVDQPASVPIPPAPQAPREGAKKPGTTVNWAALEKAIRAALRLEHYALKTEKAYVHWMRQFVGFHHDRRPSAMGEAEIHAFLSHLAINRHVAASTQNVALNAIVFCYRKVVKRELGDFSDFARARLGNRLPVVLSRQEVAEVLRRMDGVEGLVTPIAPYSAAPAR